MNLTPFLIPFLIRSNRGHARRMCLGRPLIVLALVMEPDAGDGRREDQAGDAYDDRLVEHGRILPSRNASVVRRARTRICGKRENGVRFTS